MRATLLYLAVDTRQCFIFGQLSIGSLSFRSLIVCTNLLKELTMTYDSSWYGENKHVPV